MFIIGLIACIINQGAENLSYLSALQSFFQGIPRRRMLVVMAICCLINSFVFTLYSSYLYWHIRGLHFLGVLPYDAIYGYALFLASLALLSLVIVYIRSGGGVRCFMRLTAFCIPVLVIPALEISPNLTVTCAYLAAAFPMALLACATGYLAERHFFSSNNKIADSNQASYTVFLALLVLVHSAIIFSNYNFVQDGINGDISRQKMTDLVAKPVKGILLQEDGYQDRVVYLLNFPHVGEMLLYYFDPFEELLTTTARKRMVAYFLGLNPNAFDDMDYPPGKLVQNIINSGTLKHSFNLGTLRHSTIKDQPEMSVEKFNKLSKDHDNKMLLLDHVTEQIIDVSGMDFDSVQKLMSNKEKQKAFVLR